MLLRSNKAQTAVHGLGVMAVRMRTWGYCGAGELCVLHFIAFSLISYGGSKRCLISKPFSLISYGGSKSNKVTMKKK